MSENKYNRYLLLALACDIVFIGTLGAAWSLESVQLLVLAVAVRRIAQYLTDQLRHEQIQRASKREIHLGFQDYDANRRVAISQHATKATRQ